jgi:Ca-activated chloride channel family protein
VRFADPAGLWLGLLALPVLALHVLRPRRPAVEVSSTFLWREVARPVSVAAPWQKLRPSTLLVLQLLAVALLAAAVAQPVRTTKAALARHTVFIVDASGSMAAVDGKPDRLEAAKDRARSLRGQLPGDGLASVVVADAQPRVVLSASPDRSAFDDAVGGIHTTAGPADFATAFTLAESVETPGAPVGFVLLSDGGLTDAQQGLLPPGTDYQRMGSRATNRAVTRLTVDPRGSGLHARVTLRNTGGPAPPRRCASTSTAAPSTVSRSTWRPVPPWSATSTCPAATGWRPSSKARTCWPPTTTPTPWPAGGGP